MSSPETIKATQRRLVVIFSSFCALALLGIVIGLVFRPNRPNVILVTLDATRPDHLGAYGYQDGLTKVFDDFGKYGAIFERAYAPAPTTLPSYATLLTGLYPPEHGLRVDGAGSLGKQVPILSEVLKGRGYETAAFIAAKELDSQFGLNRGFDTYDHKIPNESPGQIGEPRRGAADVISSAIAWIDKRTRRSFFCWVNLHDAHAPYHVRTDTFGDRFTDRPYDAGIAYELQEFQRLVKYLKDWKLDAYTIVIVTADHGEGLGEHLESESGMLAYNSTLRVPLIVVYPRTIARLTRVDEVVSLVDVTPTVLNMMQLPPLPHSSGRSLLPAILGQRLGARDVYAESETPYFDNHWSPLRTVISDRWKYIQTTKPELYDLKNDPQELKNLIESDPQQTQDMRNRLQRLEETFVTAKPDEVHLSDEDRANLRDIKDMLPQLAKFDKARLLYGQGNLDEGIKLLQEIIQETKDFPAADFLLANCLVQTNRLDEAKQLYRNLLAHRPDMTSVHLPLGRISRQQGDIEQAIVDLSEYVHAMPDSAAAHFELASALATAGKLDEAIAEYNETIRLAPESVMAHIGLGQIFARQNKLTEAQKCFEQAVEQDSDSPDAHMYLFMTLVQLKQFDEALVHAKKAVTLDPESFENHFNLGAFLVTQGKYSEAIEQLREAEKLRPADPRPAQHIQRAEMLSRQGRSP